MLTDKHTQAQHPSRSPLKQFKPTLVKKNKLVSAEEAVGIIRHGDTVAFCGFVGTGAAEEILVELERSFLSSGSPRDLTLMFTVATGPGDESSQGLNRLAHDGLVKRVIGGHWGLAPKIQKMALENRVEAYNLPLGVMSHMYRNIASRKPGIFSQVGLGTFVDPRNGGGKINVGTTEDLVQLLDIEGEEFLFYKAPPVHVAVIRGTTADTEGNITMEREALTLESLSLAMAARNSGGLVIAQVERVAEAGTLKCREVKVPGILVDCVVVARPENHWQTYGTPYNPALSGEIKIPLKTISPMEMSYRKAVARRAALELKANSVVNLGIGLPEGVASVASEETVLDFVTLTAEPGVIGGIPAGGINFGTALNASALIDQPYQFDFYNGGGIDIAFLGMAEADRTGNVNVSKFGPKLAGAGGFINISQNSKRVVFMGTFTAGGLKCRFEDGRLVIEKEGRTRKFVKRVEQITFSGSYGARSGREILYVTERCVFSLCEEGLELIEIAPGIDLQKDILEQMDFEPRIRRPLKVMDDRIFRPELMGLKDALIGLSMETRISYDRDKGILFANLAGYAVKTPEDMEAIELSIDYLLSPIGGKVLAIADYDDFFIDPELIDAYTAMQQRVAEKYFTRISRYTTSAFLRMKLGDALEKRGLSPHIYESRDEARKFLLEH